MSQEPARLWGGRFRSEPAPELMRLSISARAEWRLAVHDLAGSRAHAQELQRAGVLDDAELRSMVAALDALEADVRAGRFSPSDDDEDVHTALERGLLERLGALGGKLRAGRSRNDQAVTDLRLYLRDAAREVATEVVRLQQALILQARANLETIAPGFTHLQAAQPISFGHQLAAHAQALARDVDRLMDWDRRADLSPLGAAALAGSTIAVHPELSAGELGFAGPCQNSMDAVSDRDFVAEFLFAGALIGVHLSRLGEEVCLWTSRQFRWVELHDSYATGSSIMPQKKNPDIAELARGATGRFVGNLMSLLVMVKGLPLTYNRDMSHDKHEVFDTVDTLMQVLPAMSGMVATMRVNRERLTASAAEGFTLATDVADWLARQGVPFKEAHQIVGQMVRRCEERGHDLDALTDDELARIDPRLTPKVRAVLDVREALLSRSGVGATSPRRVAEQLASLEERIAAFSAWTRPKQPPMTTTPHTRTT
jgi:argininosuccinate lyase